MRFNLKTQEERNKEIFSVFHADICVFNNKNGKRFTMRYVQKKNLVTNLK